MICFRSSLLSLWLLFLALPFAARADDPEIPPMPPLDNFLRIAERSPFSGASAAAGQFDQSSGWFLSGIMYIDEKRYVILQNVETREQIYLTEGVDTHGFRLVALHTNPNPHLESVSVIVNQQDMRIGYHPDFITSRISYFRYLPSFEKTTTPPDSPAKESAP